MSIISPLRHLHRRPALLAGIAAGAAMGVVADRLFEGVPAALCAWCTGLIVYLTGAFWTAGRTDLAHVKKRAEALDEGAGVILVLTVGAAMASIGAIVVELSHDKGGNGWAVGLAAATVVLSWTFIHTVFAFHYAHAYYGPDGGCLDFPGAAKPLYWDFLYFSFVIGMTAQVADVATRSTAVRKVVTAHGVVAFFFNTAILALGVNLAAGLAGK